MNKLIVLHGATAVGKTTAAIAVAQHLKCPIINADSRQLYKEMAIGTAVPTKQELEQAKHFFIHSHSIHQSLNAGEYANQALAILDEQFKSHPTIVLSGGSGLYIKALLRGMDELPSDQAIRDSLQNVPIRELQEQLYSLDPEFSKVVDSNNIPRLIRAIEICLITGKKYSSLRTGETHERNFEFVEFALDRPREELYDRINARVEIMMSQGLEEEARTLLEHKQLSPLQTVGYRELFDYFEGTTTKEVAVELIKRNSRHYAKRQYTWTRSIPNIKWIDATDLNNVIKAVDESI